MREFGVRFERVPLMYDNTSDISVAKNPIFHKKMRHVERRHYLLRDHVEKGDIEMRYIDTFSPNPLILLDLLIYGGKLVFAIHMVWFGEGGVGALSYIFYILLFSYIFFILT
jgi:hypothetical protein